MSHIRLPKELEDFKQFVQNRPELVQRVRNKEYTWQQLYDTWTDEGHHSSFWDQFEQSLEEDKTTSAFPVNSDHIQGIVKKLADLDVDQVDKNIRQLSKALDQIQHLSHQFQQQKRRPPHRGNRFPF
ncbi:spore coat protein YlbD [Alkalibacillus haloalkaliphilus]|uniref:spore coat protein YlbD n=1 Tax=Alkalibacillus haloalkaliphilus TaxID=94136 RepID=UPI00030B325D|nr:spore coat protein YlbD [Alkalibacillus haloalkaliphilus]